jgi:ankyrin repeat protein
MNNQMPVVQYLVRSCGADVNMRDEVDMTAMHYAAGENHAEIVRFLAENGADRTMTVMVSQSLQST